MFPNLKRHVEQSKRICLGINYKVAKFGTKRLRQKEGGPKKYAYLQRGRGRGSKYQKYLLTYYVNDPIERFRVITEQDQLRWKLPTDMAGFVNQNFNVFILFKSSGRSISIRQSHSIIFRKASKVSLQHWVYFHVSGQAWKRQGNQRQSV